MDKLKNYKLSKRKGKNVTELTKIVRALVKRLDNIKDPTSGTSYLPTDISEKLLDILQTSSVPAFKLHFKLQKDIAEAAYGSGDPEYSLMFGPLPEFLPFFLASENFFLFLATRSSSIGSLQSCNPCPSRSQFQHFILDF